MTDSSCVTALEGSADSADSTDSADSGRHDERGRPARADAIAAHTSRCPCRCLTFLGGMATKFDWHSSPTPEAYGTSTTSNSSTIYSYRVLKGEKTNVLERARGQLVGADVGADAGADAGANASASSAFGAEVFERQMLFLSH